MFVRAKKRFKDGKEHRYWSVVENCRNPDGRVVQRQVLYLGEINDGQRAAWCRSIEVLCGESSPKSVALFPADREAPELDCEVVQIELKSLRLRRPRQWGACWLALMLWGAPGTGSVLAGAAAGESARHPVVGRLEGRWSVIS